MSIRVPAAQASDEDSIVGQHQVFPTELFVVIAECLAGDQSFGSLASLNLSSHAIREETLPVLFETLTFDGKLSFFMWWKMCPGIPEGIRLTKFLITTDEPSRDLAALFPKLAMTMTIKYQHDHQTPIFSCDIYLHKPLHPVTVFSSISKTRPPPFLLVTPTVATCDPFITTGPFPPERFLNRLTLGLGAFLKPDEWVPCRGTARWTTNIVLGLTALAVDPLLAVGINDDCFIDTMCEVWKMMGSRAYNASEPSSRWLFDLRLSKPLIDKFLEKIPHLLSAHPELLCKGIRMSVPPCYTQDETTTILGRFKTMFHKRTFFKHSIPSELLHGKPTPVVSFQSAADGGAGGSSVGGGGGRVGAAGEVTTRRSWETRLCLTAREGKTCLWVEAKI